MYIYESNLPTYNNHHLKTTLHLSRTDSTLFKLPFCSKNLTILFRELRLLVQVLVVVSLVCTQNNSIHIIMKVTTTKNQRCFSVYFIGLLPLLLLMAVILLVVLFCSYVELSKPKLMCCGFGYV